MSTTYSELVVKYIAFMATNVGSSIQSEKGGVHVNPVVHFIKHNNFS